MRIDNSRITPKRVARPLLSAPQTTQVVARPVDIYVKPDLNFSGSSNAQRNANLVKGLVGDVVRIAGAHYQENAKEDYLKGRQDANARLEMSDSEAKGFLHSRESYENGYRATEDEAKAIYFKSSYIQALKEHNFFLDEADPKALQDELYTELYNQTFTPEYLYSNGRNGVMSEQGLHMVKQALLAGEDAFNQAYIEDRKVKLTNANAVVVKENISNLFDKGELTAENLSLNVGVIKESIRADEGGSLLSDKELTSLSIDAISELALQSVDEGKFDKADRILEALKGASNARGIAWQDEITETNAKSGKVSYGFRSQIQSLEASILKAKEAHEKAREKAYKEWQDNNLTNYNKQYIDILAIKDPYAQEKALANLNASLSNAINKGQVGADKALRLYESVSASAFIGSVDKTPANVYQGVYTMINTGSVATLDDLNELASNHQISKSDYSKFASMIESKRGVDAKLAESKDKQVLDYTHNRVKGFLTYLGAELDIVSNTLEKIDPKRRDEILGLWEEYQLFRAEVAQRDGALSFDEARAFTDNLKKKFIEAEENNGKTETTTTAGFNEHFDTSSKKSEADAIINSWTADSK